jgi:hypothetical protein
MLFVFGVALCSYFDVILLCSRRPLFLTFCFLCLLVPPPIPLFSELLLSPPLHCDLLFVACVLVVWLLLSFGIGCSRICHPFLF